MKQDCDYYKSIQLPGSFLNLTLQDDDENKIRIHLDRENMFLNSSQIRFPPGSDFKCQIPIFSQLSDNTSDTWYLGKSMMSSYYMIFDANNLEGEDGQATESGYLQVGMGPINPDDEIGNKIIDRHEKEQQKQKEKSQAALVTLILIILLVIMGAGVYAVVKFRKARQEEEDEDRGYYYDDQDERQSKKKILIGSDIRHDTPIGPGECGINNDESQDDQSDEDINYEEPTEDQDNIWQADIAQPGQLYRYDQPGKRKKKRFSKYDWSGINNSSSSASNQFYAQNAAGDNSNSMSQDNPYGTHESYSGSKKRLIKGFGLN